MTQPAEPRRRLSAGLWFVRAAIAITVLLLAATMTGSLLGGRIGETLLALLLFWVVLPLPGHLALVLLSRPGHSGGPGAGLRLARSIGFVLAALLALLLRSHLRGWPVRPGLVATLLGLVVLQISLAAVAWTLLRRGEVDGDDSSPPAFARGASRVGHVLLVLYALAFVLMPGTDGHGISRRESAAIGNLRTLVAAEAAFAAANGGFYGPIQCLVTPSGCLPGYSASAPVFLTPAILEPTRSGSGRGYVYTFHPGPTPSAEQIRETGAAASSLAGYVYVAVPEAPGLSGVRAFCADGTGAVWWSPDGTIPTPAGGVCPAGLEAIQ